jgi:hypothetical protein
MGKRSVTHRFTLRPKYPRPQSSEATAPPAPAPDSPAEHRRHAASPEPRRVRQHRPDPRRAGRLQHEPEMPVREPHPLDHRFIRDEHDVADRPREIVQRLANRNPRPHAVRDGFYSRGLHRRAPPPGPLHARRPRRRDADDLDVRRTRSQTGRHAAQDRAVAEGNQDHVGTLRHVAQFDGDRPGAFRERDLPSVLDHPHSMRHGEPPGGILGRVEIVTVQHHARAQVADASKLQRARVSRREHRQLDATGAAGMGERLPQIAHAGGHDPRARRQCGRHQARAAPLEAADRIERLHLDRHARAQRIAHARAVRRRTGACPERRDR